MRVDAGGSTPSEQVAGGKRGGAALPEDAQMSGTVAEQLNDLIDTREGGATSARTSSKV